MNIKQAIFLVAILCASLSMGGQRIAILSDIHITPGNVCDSMLRLGVEDINRSRFDLVVVDGDLTNEGSDVQLRNVKNILDDIRHPLAVLPGNHENNWSQSATKTFVDLWEDDKFIYDIDSLLVVGINCGPYMKMGDGHIKQEDLHWLKKSLDSRAGTYNRVLSFNHYPLKEDIDNYDDYRAILAKYPVIAHINGHYHTFQKYMAGDIHAATARALDLRDGTFGYSILEILPDSLILYNKNIGETPVRKFAWPVVTSHGDSTPNHPPLTTDLSICEPNPHIEKTWTDSASIFTRLAFDADNVYFGNSLGQLRAVSKNDKQLKWSQQFDGSIFSRPVVLSNGNVAIPTVSGIYVVNPSFGNPVMAYRSSEGPYVADGLANDSVYIQGGYKRIERRNPATAMPVWSFEKIDNYCQAAPIIDGDDLIFGAWDTNLRCLSLKDGHLKWSWNNGKTANMLGPGNVVPAVTADRVIIVAPDRYMTAIDRSTGETIWRNNSRRFRESLGISQDRQRIYAKSMDGFLICVNPSFSDFDLLWEVDLGIGYDHAPCVIIERDSVVYVGSRQGVISAVDIATHSLLWSEKIGVSEVNGLDIDPYTGDIYLSLIEGTIFRIPASL